MNMPFTQTEFKQVFATYNESIWPAQIIAYLFALSIMVMISRQSRRTNTLICAILAAYWIFVGIVYHIMHFSTINPAAYAFGVLSVIQGILFIFNGIISDRLRFGYTKGIALWTGLVLIIYSMIIYPLLGGIFGHVYPESPVFGVAPCPITIFTFGILLLTIHKIPKHLLVIPAIWSLIGFTAALKLGIYQDFGLPVSALIAIPILLRNQTS